MHTENSLRERLIDVGVDLVLTEGSAALGLREIARRAGVSHGAPRRYFPTHHALLSAIARRGFADLGDRFTAAIAAATTPRAQLQAIARVYVGYALERRGMFELMFRHDLLDSEQQHTSDQPRLRESTLPLFDRIVTLVARCRAERNSTVQPTDESGELATIAPATPSASVTAAVLWSNLHGMAQLWAWGSLQLALGGATQQPGDAPQQSDRLGQLSQLDQLVAAVLDTHLGPVHT
ncbi:MULTISPECIES: TetR/AcrR family transcriptional regulator [unclassified Streptomyces]|uniref:TetR/AcrR family transcriptional regulator n=1 Tax=unclassified Streptomyces TaxID=2593676 RepID=UPI000381CF2C|nr:MULTISPECIES: TetR/AcrR family transcriptional regulator [unclassified Streptomyces]MYT28494.1 TetR family transcriptional regulator [Streptomyces sp. SID8354]